MFKSLGSIINYKTAPGLAKSVDAAVVVSRATECGNGRWQATKFRNNTLTIVASSGVAAQELVLRKAAVLAEINEALKETRVTRLIIRTA